MSSLSILRRNYTPPNSVDKRALKTKVDQEVAQFLANGGIIQKIPTGLSVGHSGITRANRQVNPAPTYGTGENNG